MTTTPSSSKLLSSLSSCFPHSSSLSSRESPFQYTFSLSVYVCIYLPHTLKATCIRNFSFTFSSPMQFACRIESDSIFLPLHPFSRTPHLGFLLSLIKFPSLSVLEVNISNETDRKDEKCNARRSAEFSFLDLKVYIHLVRVAVSVSMICGAYRAPSFTSPPSLSPPHPSKRLEGGEGTSKYRGKW